MPKMNSTIKVGKDWKHTSWSLFSPGLKLKDVGPFKLSCANNKIFKVSVNGVIIHIEKIRNEDDLVERTKSFTSHIKRGKLPNWMEEGRYAA